jgi:hypothetical protein
MHYVTSHLFSMLNICHPRGCHLKGRAIMGRAACFMKLWSLNLLWDSSNRVGFSTIGSAPLVGVELPVSFCSQELMKSVGTL